MERLPVELWALICAPLTPNQVARLCRVSSVWNRRLSSDVLWHPRVERHFGKQARVADGQWKARFAKLYLEMVMRNRPPPPPRVIPLRFVLFAGASLGLLVAAASAVVPFSLLALMSGPLPPVAVWLTLRTMALTHTRTDWRPPRALLDIRLYTVTAAIALEAFLHRSLTPAACARSLLVNQLSSALLTLVWGMERPDAVVPESRAVMLLAAWHGRSHGSHLYLWLQLSTPLAVLLHKPWLNAIVLPLYMSAWLLGYSVIDSWTMLGTQLLLVFAAFWINKVEKLRSKRAK